jgi:hypothetical protein
MRDDVLERRGKGEKRCQAVINPGPVGGMFLIVSS